MSLIRNIRNWWNGPGAIAIEPIPPPPTPLAEASSKAFEISDNYFAPLPPAPPGPCSDCGSIYLADKLKAVPRFHITRDYKKNITRGWIAYPLYCDRCLPHGDLSVVLNEDEETEYDDILLFKIRDGYFQEVDTEEGEDRFSISTARYDSITCAECSEELKCTKCSCTKKGK